MEYQVTYILSEKEFNEQKQSLIKNKGFYCVDIYSTEDLKNKIIKNKRVFEALFLDNGHFIAFPKNNIRTKTFMNCVPFREEYLGRFTIGNIDFIDKIVPDHYERII